jgi:hypothetical protein
MTWISAVISATPATAAIDPLTVAGGRALGARHVTASFAPKLGFDLLFSG